MRCLTRFFNCTCETISEDHEWARGLAIRQRLEHHIVAALGERRTVPRAMERDERAALVGRRKLMSVIKQQVVWRPMTWKRRDRNALVGTQTNFFPAVTAVFWSKHKL